MWDVLSWQTGLRYLLVLNCKLTTLLRTRAWLLDPISLLDKVCRWPFPVPFLKSKFFFVQSHSTRLKLTIPCSYINNSTWPIWSLFGYCIIVWSYRFKASTCTMSLLDGSNLNLPCFTANDSLRAVSIAFFGVPLFLVRRGPSPASATASTAKHTMMTSGTGTLCKRSSWNAMQ